MLVTSIGFIYKSEQRFALDDERKVYEYMKTLPKKQIYIDESTAGMFNYFSGYEGNENIIKFQKFIFYDSKKTYALNLSPVKDAYIVISRDAINYRASNVKGIKFPEEIFNIPKNWILQKEFGKQGKDRTEVYYAP